MPVRHVIRHQLAVAAEVGGAFSPLDLPNLWAWHDASDTGSITETSGNVSQWNDLSGNSRPFVQATGANQPETGTRSVNGLNVIDFTAANSDNLLLNTLILAGWTILTAVVGDANGGWLLAGWLGSSEAILPSGGNWVHQLGAINMGARTGTAQVVTLTNNGASSAAWVNGVKGNGGSDFTGDTQWDVNYYLGYQFEGAVCEHIACSSPLSDTDREDAEAYLMDKWGIEMVWAYFQNQAAFDTYHNAVCTAEAIPRAGRNQASQEPAILECWTDAFVEPVQIRSQGNVTTWAAHIPDAHATTYDPQLGITVPDSAVVFNPNGTVTILPGNPGAGTYTLDPNTLTYKKAKPPTVTMDGVTYDTATGEIIP